MTAVLGGPADDTQVLPIVTASTVPVDDVPVRAPDTALLGEQPGSGYVVPPALVRRCDGQVLQLTPLLYAVLDAIDGTRDLDAVAVAASDACGRTLLAEDVSALVDGTLRPQGLVLNRDGSLAPVSRANPLLALRPRFVVSSPRLTRRITAPFAVLFNPVLGVLVPLAFAAVSYWVLFDKGLASAAYDAFNHPGLLLAVFAVSVFSAGFHEFGHAAALRRGGGTPGAMGAGLYLIWPAFYTDVTDSYRLSRRARLRVDAGGLYFNAIVALAMFGIWEAVHWDGLLLVIAAQILQMIRQLPPLVRFDGYHLLADLTGVPDLFHRIGPTVRSFGPRRWRRPDSRALRPWARVVVTAWVVVVVPLLLVSAAVTVIALPRILGSTGHSIAVQAHQLTHDAAAGDPASAAVKALAIVALVIPVGGLLFMLVRAGRSYGVRAWRASAGRPVRRVVTLLIGAGIATGLAIAWWPHGNYRQIEPWERGTIQNALPATLTGGLVAGSQQSAQTVWADDGQPLPTADHPALAVVLTPRSGHGPTWVFPFNKPGAPGPGDNQAMAIVTRDGGSVYDAAFALVWVRHDIALDRNEAYAFATCQRCRAVAVGFQIVLVLGHAHVVAPQNIAAAVSYHCPGCVTEALAQQLVVTLQHRPSAAQLKQLHLIWLQALALSHDLRTLSFATLQQRLLSFERQIYTVLAPDIATPVTPSITPTQSASVLTPSATQSTDMSTEPSATMATTATGSSSGTSSPSPTASGSDSTSPSDSPSPTASATDTTSSSAATPTP